MIPIYEDESLGSMLPCVEPGASNRESLPKVAGVLDHMRPRQGCCLRGVIRGSIVDDYHFARKLPGLQDNGADRWALVESGDGHEDLGIGKRLSQDRWDRRRRIFEHCF